MYDTNGKGEQHSRRNGGGCGEVLETKCRMIILEKETDQYIQHYIAEHKLRFPEEAIMNIFQKY
jgi:hypothetical protein